MKTASISAIIDGLSAAGIPLDPIVETPWIDALEIRAGRPLPEPYRTLVRSYRFPPIELDHVELFGNLGDGSEYDLAERMFADPHLSPWLLDRRYCHIGHRWRGDYDPLCLDSDSGHAGNPCVIRLAHEDILLQRATVKHHPMWPDLLTCIQNESAQEI